ncbi:unnamed protein product [Amoebophrya sp. A25]|nr:unnamed protein product [Amoebophrya sp. A25]|eukprot:GSA25T00020707001.1
MNVPRQRLSLKGATMHMMRRSFPLVPGRSGSLSFHVPCRTHQTYNSMPFCHLPPIPFLHPLRRLTCHGSPYRSICHGSPYRSMCHDSPCRMDARRSTPENGNGKPPISDVKGDREEDPKTLRDMIRVWGMPFLCLYNGLYLLSLGGIYTGLTYDVVEWSEIVALLERCGADRIIDLQSIDPAKGRLGVAICLNPILEPARILISVRCAKPLSKWWKARKRG